MTRLLADILEDGKLGKVIRDAKVVSLWEKLVSGEIARHTEAVKINRRTLYVNVKSSVWAQELNFVKPEIIKKINERAGFMAVSDIRFKVGG